MSRLSVAATKVYVVSGTVVALAILFDTWYGTWPWEEAKAVGLGAVLRGMIFLPIGLGLGTVGILLGGLQNHVIVAERLKLIMAFSYTVGAAILSGTWYFVGPKEDFWDVRLSLSMGAGVALICLVLVFNLVGLLRSPGHPPVESKPS